MPSDSPKKTKMTSAHSSAAAASRSAASATPPWNLDTASFNPPNLIALRSSAFPDCPSDPWHTLIHALGVMKGPDLGVDPDDRRV
jgi:hypothetical protein